MNYIKLKTFTIILLLTIVTACNQEQPTGKISVEDATPATDSPAMFNAYTGDTIILTLQPNPEFEDIYGIEWSLFPDNSGEIIYSQQPEREEKEYKEDRKAVFLPYHAGMCTIHVSGFWKQTNPQHIDSVTFNIIGIVPDQGP
jgi:hypothetical protein